MCRRKEPEIEQKPAPHEPRWDSGQRPKVSALDTGQGLRGVARDRDKACLPPINQSQPVIAGVGCA